MKVRNTSAAESRPTKRQVREAARLLREAIFTASAQIEEYDDPDTAREWERVRLPALRLLMQLAMRGVDASAARAAGEREG